MRVADRVLLTHVRVADRMKMRLFSLKF